MMLRLCFWTWYCSLKPKQSALPLCKIQILNLSSNEHIRKEVDVKFADLSHFKPWKRVKKSNLKIKNILELPSSGDCISDLVNAMECDEAVVKELISRDSCLVTNKFVLEKVKLLKDHGYSANNIVANPAVLHRSLVFLKNRLQMVKSEPWFDSVTLHALIQSDKVFEQFIERCRKDCKAMEGFTSKEMFLASLFECDEKTVSLFIVKNRHLLSISPALISYKMNILAKFSIPPSFVRENSRILFHTSLLELERRLTMLKDKQQLPPNSCKILSYLLCCRIKDFSISFNIISNQIEALEGCRDALEYLCLRLKCSESDAKYFFSSPHMKRMSDMKMKQTLDFLLNETKMNSDFILKHRSLFNYSIKRLRHRWEVLCNAGYQDVTMLPSVITLTAKQFSAKFGSHVFVDTFNND